MAAWLNTVGLMLGMVGLAMLFRWGPPQPSHQQGVFLALESATPIDDRGTNVAERDRQIEHRRARYAMLSKVGLTLVGVGFGYQLLATWAPVE